MSDLAIVWYTMLDSDVTATRQQVREWAEELKLPTGTLSKTSTLGAFRKANLRTILEVEDGAGVSHTLTSHQSSKTREVVKYDVIAYAEGQEFGEKVAEVKLFQQRRTSRGVVRGSQQWKSTIKPALDGPLREAAVQWLDKFRGTYNEIAVDAPSGAVRRIVRLGLLSTGIPVLNRLGVYVFYVDQLEVVHRVEDFLSRCVDVADVAVIPIQPDAAQMARFAEAADAHMVSKIGELGDAVHNWGVRELPAATDMVPRFAAEVEGLRERVEEHERRLSSTLPHSRSVLAQCSHLLNSLIVGLELPNGGRK